MPSFRSFFEQGIGRNCRDTAYDLRGHLLPHGDRHPAHSAIPAKRVTKVAIKLKYLIEAAVSCELKESHITRPHSRIITHDVVRLAKEAGGDEDKGCVVYCLLVCLRWFKRQAVLELCDADLNALRAEACQVIAKRIIEGYDDDQDFLFQEVLLKRYSILRNGEESIPANVVERAVDLHALRVIGSSGFQKCISYIWKGWIAQDLEDPTQFTPYSHIANKSFWAHFDHDRLRAPKYQNAFQVFVSIIYLTLYTVAINTVNPTGDIDIEEACLYIFTLSFIADEAIKFWKVGRYYISFWNVFNLTLYGALTVSFVFRMVALGHVIGSDARMYWDQMSYNWLAFVAPMFWCRMLLFLDAIKFFGAMLVVLKVMMMESLIFFALLIVVIIGFLQGFVGLDNADNKKDTSFFILESMTKAILQSPEFDGFDNFAPPFGVILYYLFTFVVMVILLNILIALYNQAYTDITENAIDEYLALFANKTLQFVRAPDENVFLPPLNLIEIFLIILPFEWWLPKAQYSKLNDYVMVTLYSPFMLIIAFFESREAKKVVVNRAKGEVDDDETEEWEELQGEVDIEGGGWKETVQHTVPNVEEGDVAIEVRLLRKQVEEMMEIILRSVGEE
ncbi:Calcium channel yvc1 [Rhizina undulata]